MKDHDVTVNSMQWQPALLKLTYAAHPDVDGGQPTPCFVAPQWIIGIGRQCILFSKVGVTPSESHPPTTCTGVTISSGMIYYVTETPEQVALMRDRSMGHGPQLEAV